MFTAITSASSLLEWGCSKQTNKHFCLCSRLSAAISPASWTEEEEGGEVWDGRHDCSAADLYRLVPTALHVPCEVCSRGCQPTSGRFLRNHPGWISGVAAASFVKYELKQVYKSSPLTNSQWFMCVGLFVADSVQANKMYLIVFSKKVKNKQKKTQAPYLHIISSDCFFFSQPIFRMSAQQNQLQNVTEMEFQTFKQKYNHDDVSTRTKCAI